jgi:aspartate ammonia-lyase
MEQSFRIEKDSLGEKKVPSTAYYGIQSLRALENFPITGIPISHFPKMGIALGMTKKAAASANYQLGLLSEILYKAIDKACDEVIEGKLNDQFVIDVIQGGAGTSTNMNANEVIANRALEIMGYEKGDYDFLHPLDHVNLSQSTNDVVPTAIKIALQFKLQELIQAVEHLSNTCFEKGKEFKDVIKMGRTEMQDAVPMTLGQEFNAYGITMGEDILRIKESMGLISEISLGATAIGTGINSHPQYKDLVREALIKITGLELKTAPDLVEATSDVGAFVHLSGVLKRVVVKINKICDDLRLLSSGPRAGLNEINLPPLQPGSTIMPGKVNPVIPECVNETAFAIMGRDVSVTMAAAAGQLQLNAFLPLISFDLFTSISMLKRGCIILADKCIKGITANEHKCREYVERSTSIATFLVPHIGYDAAANIAKESLTTDKSVVEIVLEKNLLTLSKLNEILKPENMITPTIPK